ncbi:prolyl oligopeptidase family serine peptidase [Rhodococcus olei]|uniref:Prolyl oligopeptidase family serine peptidase n=1 Tax=Rhodococcus olei TaxID=2161675 RepID=A0ABP8NZR1_9NOCA
MLLGAVAAVVVSAGLPPLAAAANDAPGTVATVEALPAAASVPGAGAEYRLTYWTADHSGAPRLSTGAVHVPSGPPPPGGWPVVSYAHGTIGLADQCAPSAAGNIPQESDFTARWLRRGYAVVATDYAGLGTPGELTYLDGLAAAHNVIDMVRAARAVDPALSSRWIAAGLSQGGHAALNTAHVATAYAPDLDYRGAVALGAPTNLDQVFALGRPGIPNLGLAGLTKFVLFTMVGMRDARPDLNIDSYLSPRGRELARIATQVCTVEFNDHVGNASVGDLFSRPLDDLRPAMADYLGVPTTGYDRPLFLGQGVVDLVVPIPLTLAFVGQLTASQTDLTFRTYPDADHIGTLAAAFDDAAAFADRGLAAAR